VSTEVGSDPMCTTALMAAALRDRGHLLYMVALVVNTWTAATWPVPANTCWSWWSRGAQLA
jgi:hypothetical protein